MDNGALVFIIIIAAIVIVWQASKLKQYAKIEQMLKTGASPMSAESSTSASSAAEAVSVPASASGSAKAASKAVASAVSGSDDDELLDMPGVDPEDNIEEAKRVQLVMARCRYAEFYLEQLDDDYERGQFQRIVNSCTATARNIQDPFFRSSAMHPIVILLDRAEWSAERDELLAEVEDEIIGQRIRAELAAEASRETG